jgi:hypothetical protein
VEHFQIREEDILGIIISTGEHNPVTGVIETENDIHAMAGILNMVKPLLGDATADYYRLVKINLKDGSTVALEFGGQGRFFKVIDTGIFYEMASPEKHEMFKQQIEQAEKAYLQKE